MTIDTYPRLCGGTYFTLVLQALRGRMKAREHYSGDCDGLSDPEVLVGLIKVINPDYIDPGKENLKGTANNYKACKTSNSTYLPFKDEQVISAFDTTVQTDYQNALNRMLGFVKKFIDLGKNIHKDVNLVRALVDLILQDQTIKPDDEFYIGPDGEKIKKAALGDLDIICLPAFLLGVWHYTVVYRKNNKVGRTTYDKWCPSNGGGPREYFGDMGKNLQRPQRVYLVALADELNESNEESPVEPGIIEFSPDSKDENAQHSESQTIYNDHPVFVSQQGDGNAVISNYGTVNLTLGKH